MKRKISRYLNSKEKCEYDNLDKIFELFLNGNIKELLSMLLYILVNDYKNDFVLEKVIKEIDIKIKNHPKLKDTTLIEKKKKIYSTIAWSSLCLPLIICGSIGLYCVITKNDLKGNMWWGIFFIVIPLIVWIVFYVKSKKLK